MKYFQLEKIKFSLFKKSASCSFRLQPLVSCRRSISSHVFKWKTDCKTNGKMRCLTKTIQVDLEIFAHFLAYSGIFRQSGIIEAYSEPCITLAYSEL